MHGVNEHSSRYLDIGIRFAHQGYQVRVFDWHGHGYSNGSRLMGTLPQFFDNLNSVLRQLEPDLPLFIVAHSMGGGIILEYLKKRRLNLAGLVCVSPFIEISPMFNLSPF